MEQNTQHGGYQTRYTVKFTDFGGGVVEAMAIERTGRLMVSAGGAFALPSDRTAEERAEASREASIRRSRKAVRQRCKTARFDRIITLTYRDNMQDMGKAAADFDGFRRKMKKYEKATGFRYLACIEYQQRGAIHFHVAVRGRQNYALVRSCWHAVVGDNGGNIDVANFKTRNSVAKVAGYVAKYVGKSVDHVAKFKKRYWSSKNIDVPQPITFHLDNNATFDSAITEAVEWAKACGATDARLWLSNGLGVFWLASG